MPIDIIIKRAEEFGAFLPDPCLPPKLAQILNDRTFYFLH